MKKHHLSFEGVVLLSVPFCDIATPEVGTVLCIQLLILHVCDMRSQSAPILSIFFFHVQNNSSSLALLPINNVAEHVYICIPELRCDINVVPLCIERMRIYTAARFSIATCKKRSGGKDTCIYGYTASDHHLLLLNTHWLYCNAMTENGA